MKRRDFLAAASSMLIPVAVEGFGVRAFNKNSAFVQELMKSGADFSDRILVMIYLNGGNDGLNTVIPVEHYSQYQKLRGNIAIPENKLLPLSDAPETAFHPAMEGMRQLYSEGKLAIVHSVSYPNSSFSHVRSSDIYMTATDADKYSTTGWTGRYLEDRFPEYPDKYPTDAMEDPLAVQIGYVNSVSLLGNRQSMAISLQSPDEFYQLVGQESYLPSNDLPCCEAGTLIKAIRQQQILAIEYGAEIKRAAEQGTNRGSYPENGNTLAQQLKIVARLINGGLKTKIYYVELGGFDTHAAQVNSWNPIEGAHATLLKHLSEGILAFQRDLQASNAEDRVIGMTFSDFGRRASSNASYGTDHGVAAPTFVFGSSIKRKMVGTNPHLVNDLVPLVPVDHNNNQDIKMQIDFRRVYRDILGDWFGAGSGKTDSLLFKNFQTTSLFSDTVQTISSGKWSDKSIWSSGRVPSSKDNVRISTNHKVEITQNIVANKIDVSSGAELVLAGNFQITTKI